MDSCIILLLVFLVEGLKHCVASEFEYISTDHIYLTKYNLKYTTCVDECEQRAQCSGVQYSHRRQTCHLMDVGFVTSHDKIQQKYKVYRKNQPLINVTSGTTQEPCEQNQACDSQTKTCLAKECDRFDDKRITIVNGNVQTVGSHVYTECKPGSLRPDGMRRTRHTCNVNGTWEPEITCVPVTCNLLSTLGNQTGEYDTFDVGTMQTFKIFCLFNSDHGYTYIPPASLRDVTELSRYYTRADHVMVRHLRSNDEQFEGKFEPLSIYRAQTNITILLNTNGDFPEPTDMYLNQPKNYYIYLHLLPSDFVFEAGVKQGYRFENIDVQFARTAGEGYFNYLVIYDGNKHVYAYDDIFSTKCPVPSPAIGCFWISAAHKVVNSDRLPQDYFYNYTMHMGGGGVMLHEVWSPDAKLVTGVTFGFRFDL